MRPPDTAAHAGSGDDRSVKESVAAKQSVARIDGRDTEEEDDDDERDWVQSFQAESNTGVGFLVVIGVGRATGSGSCCGSKSWEEEVAIGTNMGGDGTDRTRREEEEEEEEDDKAVNAMDQDGISPPSTRSSRTKRDFRTMMMMMRIK